MKRATVILTVATTAVLVSENPGESKPHSHMNDPPKYYVRADCPPIAVKDTIHIVFDAGFDPYNPRRDIYLEGQSNIQFPVPAPPGYPDPTPLDVDLSYRLNDMDSKSAVLIKVYLRDDNFRFKSGNNVIASNYNPDMFCGVSHQYDKDGEFVQFFTIYRRNEDYGTFTVALRPVNPKIADPVFVDPHVGNNGFAARSKGQIVRDRKRP